MRFVLPPVTLLAAWPFASSRKDYKMTPDPSVPAASGAVHVQREKGTGSLKLDVKVKNLAHPYNLTPSENAYVIWVRPSGGEAVRQGALQVDKNLSGELKTVTNSNAFDLFITAEPSENATAPAGTKVLSAHVSA